jgi:ABC-type multidrug transport system fused ATPase/permease subunit
MMSEFNVKESLVENRLVGLWRLMDGYRPHYLVAVVAVGLAALAQASIYYLLRYFIDEVLGQDNFGMVPWIAAGFIGLALLQGAFTFVGGRLSAQTSEGIALRLRSYIYNHIQRLTFTYHDRMQTGELLQRATSDVDAVRRFFAEQMIGIGRISLLFLINFAALLLLHVQLALYSVIVIPLVVAISLYFFKKVGEAYENSRSRKRPSPTRCKRISLACAWSRRLPARNTSGRSSRKRTLASLPWGDGWSGCTAPSGPSPTLCAGCRCSLVFTWGRAWPLPATSRSGPTWPMPG